MTAPVTTQTRMPEPDGRRPSTPPNGPPPRRTDPPPWASTRPSDSLIAACATIASVLALTTLTDKASWLAPAIWCTLVVAGSGILLRRLTNSGALVVLGQAGAATYALLAIFAGSTFTWLLPTADTWAAVQALVTDCVQVMQRYAAPIPTTRGIEFVMAAIVTLLALVVDTVAVTLAAPAAAGLPLLAAFLTAAANGGNSLPIVYFLLAALVWLLLVSRSNRGLVRRWSSTVAAPRSVTTAQDTESEAVGSFGQVGRQLGALALVAAIVLPAVIPHMPTRYILDGLGRDDTSLGRGGRVGFSDTLDLSRSLRSGAENVVLTYRTTASPAEPVRVTVTSDYSGGQWRARPNIALQSRDLNAPAGISASVPYTDQTFAVVANGVDVPHVAAPAPVVSVDLGSTAWTADQSTGDLYVRQRPDAYQVTFRELNLTPAQLAAGIQGGDNGSNDPSVNASLGLDPGSGSEIRALADKVTAGAKTPYEQAVAIQAYLRTSGGFTYSLDLPEARDAGGATIDDPVLAFLQTKTGYCVQFASTMVMLARAKGIPARMAIGFLPGVRDDDGVYTVRSADAHAWPELFFPGAGWLRFEPTPSVRTGAAPAYTTLDATGTGSTGGGRAVDEPGATASPTGGPREVADPLADSGTTQVDESASDRVGAWFADGSHLVLLAVLLGLLGAFVLPLTARAVNRRRRGRAATQGELAEAQWAELVSRLDDLGVPAPPEGGTLRQQRRHYAREAYLDEEAEASMGRVVSTLERARYARPGDERVQLAEDIRVVTRSAASSRTVVRRLRAYFLPRDGVRWWQRSLRHVTDAPGHWLDTVAEYLPRRGRRGGPGPQA